MRLRTQLILVSLFMLVLPWAGCQYIGDMEHALRQGQTQALAATAHAVSARLENDEQLLLGLGHASKPVPYALYAQTLSKPLLIDGFGDDWPQTSQYYSSPRLATIRLLQDGQTLYGLLSVTDYFNYHNPSKGLLASGDHIVIQGANISYLLRAEGPGEMQVFKQGLNKQWQRVDTISAVLQENQQSYHIEFAMPLATLEQQLSLAVIDQTSDGTKQRYWIGVEPKTLNTMPLKYVQQDLNQAIQMFTRDGQRISLADKNAWLVATAGRFNAPVVAQHSHSLLAQFYRFVLRNRHFDAIDTPYIAGQYAAAEVKQALNGKQASQWYTYQNQLIARSVVPLTSDGALLGAVVVEQNTDAVLALTNSAFNRLFTYTFIGTVCIAVILLLYASWLSLRIRRLSIAAEHALADDGQLHTGLPSVKSADELGDLARSYQHLLNRVQEYTQYLRTLSDKLSHELRTPLAIVKGSLDNLSELNTSNDLAIYVDRAQKGAERLSAMLSAMSMAKRIEESIQYAQIGRVDMQHMLTDLLAAYQHAYPSANIVLQAEPLQLDIADELIVQMLDKLVDNAVDFCAEGGQIDICLQARGNRAELSISNDGPLLPEAMQYQLFDSLVSSRDKQNSADAVHMGLGLHIVKLIADFHNARVIACNRNDATGVIFTVSFSLP